MRWTLCLLVVVMSCGSRFANAAEFQVSQNSDGVEIKCDGKLVTNHLKKSGTKPILWPIIGPTGKEMTRAYPMKKDVEGEKRDHVHHRSFWFTYGDVNGISFWHEEGKEKPGLVVHREYTKVAGGATAVIASINDWMSPEGKKVCEERQSISISRPDSALVFDFQSQLIASEGVLTLGDTKEGAFGVRVPTSMDVDSKQGGTILNSEGHKNADAWGKKAAWVDYYGPVQGETCGIAIMQHPSSYRYPNRWHVRTYGLFTANPFGEKDFPGGNAAEGVHKIAQGDSISLKYRVVFHAGDTTAAQIAEAFTKYAAEK